MSDVSSNLSPETNVVPYESLNEKQVAISGERFPALLLIVCDSCNWCTTCFNIRGLINICPKCRNETSNIPLTIDENSEISYNKQNGLTIRFSRKLPLR